VIFSVKKELAGSWEFIPLCRDENLEDGKREHVECMKARHTCFYSKDTEF